MVVITLSPEQKERLRQEGTLDIRDSQGKHLVTVNWEDTAEFIEELKKRIEKSRGQPRISSAKVKEHLQALEEEWQRTGGFDKEYALRFVGSLRAEKCR